jgi:hypothetical protein
VFFIFLIRWPFLVLRGFPSGEPRGGISWFGVYSNFPHYVNLFIALVSKAQHFS